MTRHGVARLGALMLLAAPASLAAQGKLLQEGRASVGLSADWITIGGGGLLQYETDTGDSIRIRKAAQLAIPVTASVPFGPLRIDAQTFYTSGSTDYDVIVGGVVARSERATLSGISDGRFRATLSLFGDQLLLTAGINAPFGVTQLTTAQTRAVRVLAAPALAVNAPAIGAGISGTAGLVVAQAIGPWTVALGGSYEVRGKFQPLAAAAAGLPALDYLPGNSVRTSIGAERLFGQNRFALSASGDFFQADVLPSTIAGQPPIATAKLGYVVGGTMQLSVGARGFRDLSFYVNEQYRSPFDRNGVQVAASSGNYLQGGVRMEIPTGTNADILVGIDGRWHTGLDFSLSAAAAGTKAGNLMLGYSIRSGGIAVQPFVRGQLGTLTQPGGVSSSLTGYGAGIYLTSRF